MPAGAGWHAVSARGAKEGKLWPSFAVDFLVSCGEFKTVEEHLRAYARYHSMEPDQLREIEHWVEEMTREGLLVGTREVVERCVASGAGMEGAAGVRIGAIGVPTAGNAERLRRVVTSFARNARENGREVGFTVSANGAGGAGARGLLAELEASEGVTIEIMDDEGRVRYGEELARKAGVDPEVVGYALGDRLGVGFACGANRNALLLRNAGRAWLSVDDDVACEMVSAPKRKEGVMVFSTRDGFERWFYAEYWKAFEGQKVVEGDYLGMHEKMLGRGVGGLLGGEVDFVGISDEMLRRLQEREGRVVATFSGHYGHPGIPTSYYYLTYRGGTLGRLTGEGEERYREYLGSGGVLAVTPRMSIADASLSPGMAMGIDGRELIPPFPPVMHAEDFVWGAVVWQCCASGFAGHLPVAVRHDPGLGRGILKPPLEAGERPVAMWEFAHVLRGIVTGWTAPPGLLDTAERMEGLGRYLCDVAGGGAGDFHEYLRWFVMQHESEKIGFMEYCLTEERDAPEFWQRDVEEYIEQTRLALAAPDMDIPYDMRGKWSAEEARGLMQGMVRGYGRMLREWGGLWEVAAKG